MPKYSINRKNKGMTIIELMIAIVLSMMLSGAAITLFISNKRIYKEQEMMSRLQENARFAINMLLYDIRMAGYTGCAHDSTEINNEIEKSGTNTTGISLFDFSNTLEGFESGEAKWAPSKNSEIIGKIKANTDALSVRYLRPINTVSLSNQMQSTKAALELTSAGKLVAGDTVSVSDCDSTDIFYVTAIQDAPAKLEHSKDKTQNAIKNKTGALQKRYEAGAEIATVVARRYYIGTGESGRPALFRYQYSLDSEDSDSDKNTTEFLFQEQELIEGVENMQLLYGEDTSGDRIVDTFSDAKTVKSWDKVLAVRLALLISTVNENHAASADDGTYTLLGGTGKGGHTVKKPNDNRQRRIFTTTVQIRNRNS